MTEKIFILVMLAIVLLFSGWAARAGDMWLMNGALVVDWAQTRQAMKHGGFVEKNSQLGANPSPREVDRHFLKHGAAYNAIALALPKQYRKYFTLTIFGVESYVIIQNHRAGVRLNIF